MTELRLEHLAIGYTGRKPLLDDASARLGGGRLVALLGRNGAGKSTLLRTMAGLDRPLAGDVVVDGRGVGAMTSSQRARALAVVTTERPQVPHMTVRSLVELGRAPYTGWTGRLRRDDYAVVGDAIRAVGMEDFADRAVDTLSDGEARRAMTARALAQQTPVLMLDEPTSFLDIPARRSLVDMLRGLARDMGRLVVFSTHELDLALRYADSLLLIHDRRLFHGSPDALAPRLAEAFGDID